MSDTTYLGSVDSMAPQPVADEQALPMVEPTQLNGHRERRDGEILSRAEVRRMRELEVRGVPFFLHRTGVEATVRAFNILDAHVLEGFPPQLQALWTAALNSGKTSQTSKTFSDYVAAAANDDRMAAVACVAGFIRPRIVLREEELDGSDECWLYEDLHVDERKRYLQFVMGNANEEELKRLAAFRDTRMAAPSAR